MMSKFNNQKQLVKFGEKLANHQTFNHSRQPVKPRNYLALNPLLQKGGLHEKEDVDIARKRARRKTRQQLRKTDWLSGEYHD